MEIYLNQHPVLAVDHNQPDLFTFPLPPTKDAQSPPSGNNIDYRKSRLLMRTASIPKNLKSIDINLTAARREAVCPINENVFFPESTSSMNSSSDSQSKDWHRLPRLPQDLAADAQCGRHMILSESTDDPDHQSQPVKAVKSKCARYPISYKLRTNSKHRPSLAVQANGATPLCRVKSSYEDSHSNVGTAPPPPASTSSPDLHFLATSPPTSQSHLCARQSQHAEGVPSLIPPPRSASIRYTERTVLSPPRSSHYSKDAASIGVAESCEKPEQHGRATVAANYEDAELESIQTVQLNIDDQSDHTTLSRKSSIIHRPHPLGRGRGQSFSTPYAEFDKLMSLKASGSGSSITPGRHNAMGARPVVRRSPSLKSQHSCSATLNSNLSPKRIYSTRSFASEGANDHFYNSPPKNSLPRLVQSRRFSTASRRSFFSSLAKLDLDQNPLNLELHLPSDSRDNKVELCPEIQAQINARKNKNARGIKIKKSRSFKLKKTNSTLRQENRNLVPTIPDSFLQVSPKLPEPTTRGPLPPTSVYHKLRKIASLRSDRDKSNDHHQSQTKPRSKMFPCLDPRRYF